MKRSRSQSITSRPALLGCVILLMCLMPALVPGAWGQQDERAVRAAFVYNLTKYVEWPQPRPELVVGVVGAGEVGEVLESILAGKNSGARVIRVLRNPNEQQLEDCDILYLLDSSPQKVRPLLRKLRNKAILSVGEDDRFSKNGGMVGLVRIGDHIQIQINLGAVQQSGLQMSSRLLNLATIVRATETGD